LTRDSQSGTEGSDPACSSKKSANFRSLRGCADAGEILALRARLNEIYVKHTGQPLEAIQAAVERDKFLSPAEAKEFGLIDEVVENRSGAPE